MYILRNNIDWCRDHHQWGTNKKQNGWSTQQHFGQPLTLLIIKIITGNCAIFQSDDHDPHHKVLLPLIPIMVVIFIVVIIITSPQKMVNPSIFHQRSYICMNLTWWRVFKLPQKKIKCFGKKVKEGKRKKKYNLFLEIEEEEEKTRNSASKSSIMLYRTIYMFILKFIFFVH